MKYLISMAVTATIVLQSCAGKADTSEPQSLMEVSKQELTSALNDRDQLLSLVKEISESMDQIKHLEGILLLSGPDGKENSTQRTKIQADLRAVRHTLEQRRLQLASVEERLQQSEMYTEDLKGVVEILRTQLNRQAADIANLNAKLDHARDRINMLNNEVDSLNSSIAVVNEHLDSAEEASVRLANQLNTCYYVIATKAELKQHHILETGFLRKSRLLENEFDRKFFVTSDKRVLQWMTLPTRKSKVITNNPPESYKIENNGGEYKLVILDADEFWSRSNYLVVQTD